MTNDSLIDKLEDFGRENCKTTGEASILVRAINIIRAHLASPDVVEAAKELIAELETWENGEAWDAIPKLKAAIKAMGDARKGEEAHSTEPSDSCTRNPSQLGDARNIESSTKRHIQISIMEDALDAIRPYLHATDDPDKAYNDAFDDGVRWAKNDATREPVMI